MNIVQELDSITHQFVHGSTTTVALLESGARLEQENSTLKSLYEACVAELKDLLNTISEGVKESNASLDYANQNSILIRQISQVEKSIGEYKQQVEGSQNELKTKEEELVLALHSSTNRELAIPKHSEETEKQYDDVQKEELAHTEGIIAELEENHESKLDLMRTALLDKHEELISAKKEITSVRQSYDLRIQKLRLKHEEQLLKVAQASSESSQLEALRNKLISQRKSSDEEIAKLKKVAKIKPRPANSRSMNQLEITL